MNFFLQELLYAFKVISISITTRFSGPDASRDVCQECGAFRKFHGRDHPFKEKEN